MLKSSGRNAGELGQIKMLNASQIVITLGEMKDVLSSFPENGTYVTFQPSGLIAAPEH